MNSRSLAASRVLTASALLHESTRGFDWFTAQAMLTDDGLWSREAHLRHGEAPARAWSLHLAAGGDWWLAVLIGGLCGCALLIGIGWHTLAFRVESNGTRRTVDPARHSLASKPPTRQR